MLYINLKNFFVLYIHGVTVVFSNSIRTQPNSSDFYMHQVCSTSDRHDFNFKTTLVAVNYPDIHKFI
jgi:hypothetical protein